MVSIRIITHSSAYNISVAFLDVPKWLVDPPPTNPHGAWLWARWKARTDLIWLCNNILHYPDVSMKHHGLMISRMQQFPAPESIEEANEHDFYDSKTGTWTYRPLMTDEKFAPKRMPDPKRLPGKRRRLLLAARNTLKSTVNLKGHTIQWMLNYPDISIILFQASDESIAEVIDPIREFFHGQERMRDVFPEYCVDADKPFGQGNSFNLPCRTPGCVFDMPTIQGRSIYSGTAGKHVHLIKYSDIVNEKNSQNDEQLIKMTDAFYMSENLLTGSDFWVDVEGTRYSQNDLYGRIIHDEIQMQTRGLAFRYGGKMFFYRSDAEKAAGNHNKHRITEVHNAYIPDESRRTWDVFINGCYKRDYEKWGKPATYDYDDLECPLLIDPNGNNVPNWPERESLASLQTKARRNYYIFSCQQLNRPQQDPDGDAAFPVDILPKLLKPRSVFTHNVRVAYHEISVDTTQTTSNHSAFCAIVCAAVDSSGEVYVVEVDHGRFVGNDFVDRLIKMYEKYNLPYASVSRVLMEKIPYNEGLKWYLNRAMQMRNVHMPLVDVPRDSSESKVQRIKAMFGCRYRAREIHFVVPDWKDESGKITVPPKDDWPDWLKHLEQEMANFAEPRPLWYVDIMDAISDLFWGKEWHGREMARANPGQWRTDNWRKFFNIAPDELKPDKDPEVDNYYSITGGF